MVAEEWHATEYFIYEAMMGTFMRYFLWFFHDKWLKLLQSRQCLPFPMYLLIGDPQIFLQALSLRIGILGLIINLDLKGDILPHNIPIVLPLVDSVRGIRPHPFRYLNPTFKENYGK